MTGIPFTSINVDIDESRLTQSIMQKYDHEAFSNIASNIVMGLARAKAQSVISSYSDSVVIGSDTIVTVDSSVLGKPTSKEDALRMLRLLSGKDHYVYTGVSILGKEKEETFYTVTCVSFYPWSQMDEELAFRYIATGLPMDKAGAYGIQDLGALFIREIKGDYYTVMGFPVSEVYRRLEKFGF
jgi:septum formation protein